VVVWWWCGGGFFLTDNNTTPTKVVLSCFGLLVGLWQLGGMSMEDWKETARFDMSLVSCGEIDRDFCFVGKNEEFS
jgi:hypothetical protein